MKNKEQGSLFENIDDLCKWKDEWKDMPEFIQEDIQPIQQIIVSFETKEDVKKFSELIGQKLTYKTKSIWFPEVTRDKPSDFVYTQKNKDADES